MTSRMGSESPWYELFSRGAADWLRHNQKVRDAVRANLPDMVAEAGLSPGSEDRMVRVPVRLLEHARFRLADPAQHSGTGQGRGAPGEILRPARQGGADAASGGGGQELGEFRFVLEMKLDEILDWLWEELRLPNLKPRALPSRTKLTWCARAGIGAVCARGWIVAAPSRRPSSAAPFRKCPWRCRTPTCAFASWHCGPVP